MVTVNCRTRLISDLPVTEDSFGPHSQLASTIATLVRSRHEPGKVVALEGGWGSGKSTVVNLLKGELKDSNDILVSVFDAWSHHADPLRRTFLETLLHSLSMRGWLQSKTKWDERQEEIAGRVRKTKSKETPRLTRLGSVVAGALMVVPLGVALASMAGAWDLGSNRALAITGGFLAGMPLWVLSLVGLAWALGKVSPPVRKMVEKLIPEGDDALALIAGRTVLEKVSQTHESPDPTSVEFARDFKELMEEVLKDDERRLVLVLDNLDRVEAKDALAIWSSMQTFLQQSEHSKPGWLDRLWVIIPFDPNGIKRVWDRDPGTAESDGGVQGLSAAFLDKTFQLRFEVPPPVLSDWRAFLSGLLREALPDHDESEFHAVYRVFAMYGVHEGRSPTPRHLKLYVNGIGAIHLQREDEFPLSHLAYYVLLRRDGVDVPRELLTGNVPTEQVQSLLAGSARDSLAALYFNVEVDRARQLLLDREIAEALSRGDPERLLKVARVHPEGFWAVFEASVSDGKMEWEEAGALANGARVLAESRLLEEERSEVQVILAELRRSAIAILAWAPFNENMGAGLAALCQLLKPDADLVSKLLGGISSSPVHPPDAPDGATPANWGKALLTVLRQIRSLGLTDADLGTVTVAAVHDGWVGVCHSLAQDDPTGEFWRVVKPQAPVQEISSTLAETVSQGNFSTAHADTVRVTVAGGGEGSWADLASAISGRLQAPNNIAPEEALSLFDALCLLRDVEPSAEGNMSNLGTQGHALHHLHQVHSHADAAAWCMYVFLRAVHGAQQPPAAVGNSQAGYDQLQELLSTPPDELVSKFVDLLAPNELQLLFAMVDANPQSTPFVMSCLRVVGEKVYAPMLLTPEVVVQRWSLIEETFEMQDLDGLVQRLSKETELEAHVRGLEFDLGIAGLCASLVRGGATRRARFRTWCLAGLRAITQKEWERQLREEGPLIDLLLTLLDKDIDVRLDIGYQDALAEHGKALVGGSCTVSRFRSRWSEVLRPLDEDARAMLRRRLLDAAAAANGDVAAGFFDVYGEEISNSELLRLYPDAPYRLFTPLLSKREETGLRWLANLIRTNQDFFRDAFDRATSEYFKGRIRQELSEEAEPLDEAGTIIREIARLLGVRRTPRKGGTAPEASD